MYRGLILNKIAGFQAASNVIKKETPKQVLSCEFCELFKNTFFTEQVQTTASVGSKNYFKTIKEDIKRCSMKYVIFQSSIYNMKLFENLPKSMKVTSEGISFK